MNAQLTQAANAKLKRSRFVHISREHSVLLVDMKIEFLWEHACMTWREQASELITQQCERLSHTLCSGEPLSPLFPIMGTATLRGTAQEERESNSFVLSTPTCKCGLAESLI